MRRVIERRIEDSQGIAAAVRGDQRHGGLAIRDALLLIAQDGDGTGSPHGGKHIGVGLGGNGFVEQRDIGRIGVGHKSLCGSQAAGRILAHQRHAGEGGRNVAPEAVVDADL